MAYWKTHDGAEVDFVVETPDGLVAIEVKSGSRWDHRFGAGIAALRANLPKGKVRAFGVYTGPRALLVDDIRVLPWQTFLGDLWSGAIVG